jgi:hypothetical protein
MTLHHHRDQLVNAAFKERMAVYTKKHKKPMTQNAMLLISRWDIYLPLCFKGLNLCLLLFNSEVHIFIQYNAF